MDFYSESNINRYEVSKLYGLASEYNKISNFCKLVWSNSWSEKKDLYKFAPSIMLYGSPGTGKTTLLKNVAYSLKDDNLKYVTLSLELMLDKDLGMSSKRLRDFFEHIKSLALQDYKVFVHFDDVDSVLCSRYISNESSGVKRFVNTFIKEIDYLLDVECDYLPIISITTNMFSMIDTAVKRRFSLKFEIENRVSVEEFRNWIYPMCDDLKIKNELNYELLYKLMNEKELTNFDVYLILQELFLEQLTGIKVTGLNLVQKFEEAKSSKSDFERQRKQS
ncbi:MULTISPECIES: AAA family ATPase [Vibrio]|uniref:ATPase n=2 Tax=Vibrio cyclitrophicus TaxID=47951 RepID=A0A7Z1MLH2_9VIBR|nr:ATP-binding protein [Vibrio cyclitrophicus]OED90190.1 ATPase [Vibrio cyclitrophicus ZF30]OEE18310.1 ATPase [Vibrio cyclitrophicus ZF207]PMJ31511.1 ATPase [Vibrio cyclitrophicus]PMP19831.1 ATPase [Vibrio cyclitrophicus]PMP31674.1 ATPase [Vibrio cyclitrophicus]